MFPCNDLQEPLNPPVGPFVDYRSPPRVTILIKSKEPRISFNVKLKEPRKTFICSDTLEEPQQHREGSALMFRVRLLQGGIQQPRQQRPGEAGELKGLLGNPAEEM